MHHYATQPRTIAGTLWRLVVIDSRAVPGARTVQAQFSRGNLWHAGTLDVSVPDTGPYGLPLAVATAFRADLPAIDRAIGRQPDGEQTELATIADDLRRADAERRAEREAAYAAESARRARGDDLPLFAT
jgi:hypothetical protein